MATIVDQFIVKYTLDTKDLDKGISSTEKKLDKFKRDTKDAGNSLGDSIEAGAKRASGSLGILGTMLGKGGLIGVALGSLIYAGKVVDDKMFKIAQGLRRLGIDAKNFGMVSKEMRNLQYASEMAGGSLEDATQTVGDLSKSLFNLKFNGQVSESLIMLSRLGVQFQDSYGRARDFNDVMLDTASAIEKAKMSGRMTDAEAFQFASQAGFQGGMAQMVTGGRANAERELARQRARTQADNTAVKAGTGWVRASTSLGQAAEAGMGVAAMEKYGNIRAKADEKIERAGDYFKDAAETFGDAVSKFLNPGGSTIDRARAMIARRSAPKSSGSTSGTIQRGGAAAYAKDIAAASAQYGIPEEVLTGLLRTESGFDPNAVGKATKYGTAKGIAQLLPGTGQMLGVVPGADAGADIRAAAEYLAMLRKAGAGAGMDPTSSLMYAVDAYHTGPGNIASGKNIGPESMAYSGKVFAGTAYENLPRPWMPGGGSSTSIEIGSISIHTQATDANGIGDSIAGVTKNKLLAAHAERGTN